MPKTRVLGPIEWIGCARCEKFKRNFVWRNCALMAPVRPVLHRLRAVTKWSGGPQNISFGSNGVDQVHSLQKCQSNFVYRTWALIALVRPVLHRFRALTKWSEKPQNMCFCSNGVDPVRSLRKMPKQLRLANLGVNSASSASFASTFV
jgi:hypothetical protein